MKLRTTFFLIPFLGAISNPVLAGPIQLRLEVLQGGTECIPPFYTHAPIGTFETITVEPSEESEDPQTLIRYQANLDIQDLPLNVAAGCGSLHLDRSGKLSLGMIIGDLDIVSDSESMLTVDSKGVILPETPVVFKFNAEDRSGGTFSIDLTLTLER